MKTLAIALTLATAVITGTAFAPLPAQANGRTLVFEVNPTTRAETRAVRRALATMAVREDIRLNGHISQNGVSNAAAIFQNGRGSTAVLQQQGNGHTGSITQTGRNNAYGLFQFGTNTEHHVVQEGRRQTGMTVIIGR